MATGKLAIVAITENGLKIGKTISETYTSDIFVSERFQSVDNTKAFVSLKSIIKDLLAEYDAIVFIMAVGAVVRLVSPYLKNKFEDTPVIAIDDSGKFVIPVIGGHHGSNELSKKIADLLNATAVITTASEVNGVPSLEMLAQKYSMSIKNPQNIAKISMDLINHSPVNIINKTGIDIPELKDSGNGEKIIISYEVENNKNALILIPEVLDIGIGFSTDATYSDLKFALESVFGKYNFYMESIRSFSTISVKSENIDLKKLAADLNCLLNYYPPDKLNEASATRSEIVYRATGAYSVANAAARISSYGGVEIVPKEIINNTTISVFLHGH